MACPRLLGKGVLGMSAFWLLASLGSLAFACSSSAGRRPSSPVPAALRPLRAAAARPARPVAKTTRVAPPPASSLAADSAGRAPLAWWATARPRPATASTTTATRAFPDRRFTPRWHPGRDRKRQPDGGRAPRVLRRRDPSFRYLGTERRRRDDTPFWVTRRSPVAKTARTFRCRFVSVHREVTGLPVAPEL
jgi:hypothetical protein